MGSLHVHTMEFQASAANKVLTLATCVRKNAVRALVGCSIVALKVAMLERTSDDSCHPQDFCWRKFWETTLTIDRAREYACHYGGEVRIQ